MESERLYHLLFFQSLGLLLLFQLEFTGFPLCLLLAGQALLIQLASPGRSHFLLLLGLGSNHLSKRVLFLFLLLDDLKVGIFVTHFVRVNFLVILQVDLVVVLILATSSANALPCVHLIFLIQFGHQVAMLTIQRILELKSRSITLDVLVLALIAVDTLGIAVILESIRIFSSEFLKTIFLQLLNNVARNGPGLNVTGIFLVRPASLQFCH